MEISNILFYAFAALTLIFGAIVASFVRSLLATKPGKKLPSPIVLNA